MAQVGGCLILSQIPDAKDKLFYLVGVEKARFRRPVMPGDQIVFTVEVVSARHKMYRAKGEARVDGQLCAEAEILSSLVERASVTGAA
jgi:3-hydroxyacyl-[acyl-carrier-protein] dehydratase